MEVESTTSRKQAKTLLRLELRLIVPKTIVLPLHYRADPQDLRRFRTAGLQRVKLALYQLSYQIRPRKSKKRVGIEPTNPRDHDLNVTRLTTSLPLLKKTPVGESNPGSERERLTCYRLHQRVSKPPVGIEPTTPRLRVLCSTELS